MNEDTIRKQTAPKERAEYDTDEARKDRLIEDFECYEEVLANQHRVTVDNLREIMKLIHEL